MIGQAGRPAPGREEGSAKLRLKTHRHERRLQQTEETEEAAPERAIEDQSGGGGKTEIRKTTDQETQTGQEGETKAEMWDSFPRWGLSFIADVREGKPGTNI